MAERDYAYEALAEVSATDMNEGRGQLNAALKSIKAQAEIEDSYLLACEIHIRAKQYRSVFEGAALTPTALAKHWLRVHEETRPRKPLPPPKQLPPSRRNENLAEVHKLRKAMGWE